MFVEPSKLDGKLIIAVIGVGYVGLPLALEFSKHYGVKAFDTDRRRIQNLSQGFDATQEVSEQEIRKAQNLCFTAEELDLTDCEVFIITVPTPLAVGNFPDLAHVKAACKIVGKIMSPGAHVIFESTVYPGATDEECIPILEVTSGLRCNEEFLLATVRNGLILVIKNDLFQILLRSPLDRIIQQPSL